MSKRKNKNPRKNEPTEETEIVLLTSKDVINYKEYSEQLTAKLVYLSPTEWEVTDLEDAQSHLCQHFHFWMTTYNFDSEQIVKDYNLDLWGLAGRVLFLSPTRWRTEFLKDEKSIAGRKMVTLVKSRFLHQMWDELFNDMLGTEDFEPHAVALADVVEKTMSMSFCFMEDMFIYIDNNHPLLSDPKFKMPLSMQWAMAWELPRIYEMEDYWENEWFALEYRNAYDYLSWSGQADGLNTVTDMRLREYSRIRSSGGIALIEHIFLLERFTLPQRLREDKYWARIRVLTALIYTLLDDINAFERQAKLEEADNIIISYVRNGLDLATAIEKTVKDTNDAMLELHDLAKYMKTGKHKVPEQYVALHQETIELMISVAAGAYQGFIVAKEEGLVHKFD